MERRIEDRFSVQSPATIIPLDDPTRRITALLADVSASGLRLISSENLDIGKQVVVELESHLALAEIRYGYTRGSKFVLGVLKHKTVARLDLPDNADWSQMLRTLGGEVTAGSNSASNEVSNDASKTRAADEIAINNSQENGTRSPVASDTLPAFAGSVPITPLQIHWSPEQAGTPSVRKDSANGSLLDTERQLVRGPSPVMLRTSRFEVTPAEIPLVALLEPEVLEPNAKELKQEVQYQGEPAITGTLQRESLPADAKTLDAGSVNPRPRPHEPTDANTQIIELAEIVEGDSRRFEDKPLEATLATLRDAEALPELKERSLGTPEPVHVAPKPASRTWVVSSLVVAGVLALAVAGFIWGPFRGATDPAAQKTTQPAQPAPTFPPMVVSAVSSSASNNTGAPNTASGNSASVSPARRHVVILSRATNWISACTDTKEQYAKLLLANDKLDFYFNQKAVVRMGNSGASQITVDGKALGPIGSEGSLRVIALDPNAFQYLAGLPADGSADCPAQ